MTKEEKQLLLKDLCARLLYGVKYNYGGNEGCDYTMEKISPTAVDDAFPLEDVKPYLRPMSSMTEEEAIKYVTLTHYNVDDDGKPYRELTVEAIDWLNTIHVDYRGLIPMGLALEAPEGMYKTK